MASDKEEIEAAMEADPYYPLFGFMLEVKFVSKPEDMEKALKYFFSKFRMTPCTDSICPSCGYQMFYKHRLEYSDSAMACAYVKSTKLDWNFLVPICKDCLKLGEKLPPFKVALGNLLPIKKTT